MNLNLFNIILITQTISVSLSINASSIVMFKIIGLNYSSESSIVCIFNFCINKVTRVRQAF